MIKNYAFFLPLLLSGCAISPQYDADIKYCSEFADAPNAMTRLGNNKYWDCLDSQPYRAEKRQEREAKKLAAEQEKERREQENLQKALAPHKAICREAGYYPDTPEIAECVMKSYQNSQTLIQRANEVRQNNAPDYSQFLKPPTVPKITNCSFSTNSATCIQN